MTIQENKVTEQAGYFGIYGGRYVAEPLMEACLELEESYNRIKEDPSFWSEYHTIMKEYVGRPTPISKANRLSEKLGIELFLKREDLAHTGSHKLNNVIGQCLLAKQMGKTKVIAETGAGQHGVATATGAALFGLDCTIYMGEKDAKRQELNVFRMELLGAKVVKVSSGSQTLKDAINEALRSWVSSVGDTYYLIGSVMGPHPYPTIVRDFQRIISKESRSQFLEIKSKLPDYVVACVGGGSNAIGSFYEYIEDDVILVGVEAQFGSASINGAPGVVHGMMSKFLQDEFGQIIGAHSISAGLDYPGIGPEHAYLQEIGRARYETASDKEVLEAFIELAETEGLIPALECAHSLSWITRAAASGELVGKDVLMTLSGRGDKDVELVKSMFGNRI